VLYRIVRDHLETFFAHARESYARPLPAYVEHELRGYLRSAMSSTPSSTASTNARSRG
jgi:hypothetical protein